MYIKKKTCTVILFLYVKEVETGLKTAYDLNVNVLRSGISPEAINSPHFGSIIIHFTILGDSSGEKGLSSFTATSQQEKKVKQLKMQQIK